MISKQFNSLEEIQKYYIKEINTYVFKEGGIYIDLVVFSFDLNIKANIDAKDIKAWDINAWNIDSCDINAQTIIADNIIARDINAQNIIVDNIVAHDINAQNVSARDINAWNINVNDISYYAVCFAYKNIKCKSIEGERENHKHFVLDGKLEVEDKQ